MNGWDDLPIETRREMWGWFGNPWPSGICMVDDTNEINWDMQKPVPVGERCAWCDEPFDGHDQGTAIPHLGDGGYVIRHQHKECGLRQVVGSFAHLSGDCPGDGSCNHEDTGLTARQDALAAWDWVMKHGIR